MVLGVNWNIGFHYPAGFFQKLEVQKGKIIEVLVLVLGSIGVFQNYWYWYWVLLRAFQSIGIGIGYC